MKESTEKINILYGKTYCWVNVPKKNLLNVIQPPATYTRDQIKVIKDALENPIKSPGLKELSKDAGNIVIITNDITRAMPSKLTLPAIIGALSRPEEKNITILIATGLHRPMTEDEMKERFGYGIAGRYRIVNHDAKAPGSLTDLGRLSTGNRLFLNSLAVDCDLLIAEGFIEPHFFAGFSGGRKSVLPGIAGESTILFNHRPENISSAYAVMGRLEGNPIHTESLEACGRSRLKFILNVALNMNKEIEAAFAGHPVYAHEKGCRYVERQATYKVRPADIVISSNSGYPLDINLYQAVKGMVTAAKAAKDGGVIIIAAKCSEGVGHGFFKDFILSCGSIEELYEKANGGSPEYDKWQVQEYAEVLKDHRVILVSDVIDKETAKGFFLMHASGMDEALDMAFKIKGEGASVNVIPEGPVMMPVIE